MNKKIRRLIGEIERRSGISVTSYTFPDDMAEQFFTDVLRAIDLSAGPDGCVDGQALFSDVLTGSTRQTNSRQKQRLR
jgi:hypothetical protein